MVRALSTAGVNRIDSLLRLASNAKHHVFVVFGLGTGHSTKAATVGSIHPRLRGVLHKGRVRGTHTRRLRGLRGRFFIR